MMGRKSRERKRALLAASIASVGKGDSVPGGYVGAVHRNMNGQATPADIDFLTRLSRESKGRDGYTNANKPNRSGGVTMWNPSYSKDKEVFHCAEANEITSKCPLNPPVPAILIPITMWECFLACCKEYDTEWIALLMGKLDKDVKGDPAYIIDKFYFPPQTATGAHVDVPTGVRPKAGTIGAIHSHVDMGVFWSGTDTAHSNWPVEIVINRKENYEALSRYQLKCGEWAKGKSEVRLVGSWVSARIDAMISAAFDAGNKLRGKVVVPAEIHPDDQAEVATAIVTTSTPHTINIVPSSCPTCKSAFTYVRMGACLDSWHNKDRKDIAKCSLHSECVRYAGHMGWCEREDKTYFLMEGGKITKDDRWDKAAAASSVQASLPLTTQSDDPTETDLPAEEYCSKCEGYGYVEGVVNGKTEVLNCPECLQPDGKSDGLSPLGRQRAKEAEEAEENVRQLGWTV